MRQTFGRASGDRDDLAMLALLERDFPEARRVDGTPELGGVNRVSRSRVQRKWRLEGRSASSRQRADGRRAQKGHPNPRSRPSAKAPAQSISSACPLGDSSRRAWRTSEPSARAAPAVSGCLASSPLSTPIAPPGVGAS